MSQPDSTQVRQISLAEKKEIMWNVIEPGDPYDIRKSMIAKLPGQTKFMGPHLQLVCLLQAAEIERLCRYLDEHQQKLRQSQRVVLDRHSYEVQIKELTEKLSLQQNCKTENQKLKEFIRRQSKELEEAQRSHTNMETTRKYQQSLASIEQLRVQNRELSQAKIDSLEQISLLKQKCQEKDHQLQQAEQKYLYEDRKNQQINATLNQHENRFGMLAGQIERLNIYLRDKSKEMNEQVVRNKQLQDENRHWHEQCAEQESKNKNLFAELKRLQSKNKEIWLEKSTYEERQSLIRQYESRLEKLSIEVNRLNSVLRKKLNELQEAKVKIRQQQLTISNIRFTEQQTAELRGRFSQITKKMFEYEKQINIQVQEIERVNFQLKRTTDQNRLLEAKLKNTEKQLQHWSKQFSGQNIEVNRLKQHLHNQQSQLKNMTEVIDDQKRQIQEYDSIVRRYNHDEEQQRAQLSTLKGQIETAERQLRQVHDENSAMRMTIMEQQQRIDQTIMPYTPGYEASPEKKSPFKKNVEKQIILENRQSLEEDKEQKIQQFQDLIVQNDALKQQLNQRNKLITTLTIQLQTLGKSQIKMEEEEAEKPKEQIDISHTQKVTFSQLMQNLKEAKADPQNQEEKPSEERRQSAGEVARLTALLRNKDLQIKGYLHTLQEYRQKVRKFEIELNNLNRQLQSYKQDSNRRASYTPQPDQSDQLNLMRVNMQKIRAQSFGKDQQLLKYQSKIQLLGEEIERLNGILKAKMNENQQLLSTKNELINKISSQDTALAQCRSTLYNQSTEIQRVNNIYIQKNNAFNQLQEQFKSMQGRLTFQFDQMTEQLAEQKAVISNLNTQLDTVNRQLEQKNKFVDSLQDYEKNIKEYQNEIDRLNSMLRNNANLMENVSEKDQNYLNQIQRLNNLLRLKIEDNETKQKELESQRDNISELTQQLKNNEQSKESQPKEQNKHQSSHHSHSRQITELQEQFRKVQIVMKALRAENQHLQDLKSKIQDLAQKNRWLGEQIKRVNELMDQQNFELNQLRVNYSDNSVVEKRISEILSTTALRHQVDEKEKEVKHWKGEAIRSHLI